MTNLVEILQNLEQLDLIYTKKSEPDLEYAFKHVFTQESVYGSLLRSDRRQLHQQIGEALENIVADEFEDRDMALLLAYHFEQSNDKERALKYLRQAADNATATFANEEAKSLYERAMALLEKTDYEVRWEILTKHEHILDRLGERERQANVLTQLQTLAELLEDNVRLAAIHNRRAAYFDKISEYQAAAEAAEVGLRIARRSNNEFQQAESLNALALAAWRRFDYPETQKWALESLDALKVVGEPVTRAISLLHLGKASYRLGQYDLAVHYCQAAQKLTHNTDNRDGEATSHLVLGWIYQRLGDYDLAAKQFQATYELRHTMGDRYGKATALSHLGWLAYDQRLPKAGLDYCHQALDVAQIVHDRENEAYALSGLGLNYEQLGHLDKAAANYKMALEMHEEIGASTLVIFDRAGLARIALAQDDFDTARHYMTPVSEWILSGSAQKFWDPWIIYQSGYQVLTTLGDTDTAYSILNEAHTILHQRSDQISDETLRRCFLKKVQVNRELEETWHSLKS